MIMRPVIGFSMSFDDTGRALMARRNYVAMVRAAGGEPVLLPTGDEAAAARLIGMCDGLLLTGGDDVNPERYGEQALECCGNITPERDLFERALVMAALRAPPTARETSCSPASRPPKKSAGTGMGRLAAEAPLGSIWPEALSPMP